MAKQGKFSEVNGRTFKIVKAVGKLPFHVIIISADGSEKIQFRCKTLENAYTTMQRFNPNIPATL